MRTKVWILGASYLMLASIISCGGSEPAPPPPVLEEASYNETTETLTLTFSDGRTVEADLDGLVTSEELPALPEELTGNSVTVTDASYDASTQILTVRLSDGAAIQADLVRLTTDLELSGALGSLPVAAASITVERASYNAPTNELILVLSDGTTVRTDLSELATDAELAGVLLDNAELVATLLTAQATPEPVPIPATVRDVTYNPRTQTLTVTLTNGATVQADLNALITTTELTAVVAALPATPTPVPTPAPPPPPPPYPNTALDVGMANLGPYIATNYDAGYFQNRYAELVTHETLFVMGFDGEWGPRLVKDFHISPDALTYTLNLQEGARWHDVLGDWGEFTSKDFVWSIQEVSHEGSAHVQAGNTRRLFACEGCRLTRIDDYTVELKRPSPTFQLTWFSQAPIPGFSMNSKKHFDAVGREAALLQDVGTGAWEQVEYVTDVRRA